MNKEEHELDELTNTTNKERIIYKDLSFRIMEAVFEVYNILVDHIQRIFTRLP